MAVPMFRIVWRTWLRGWREHLGLHATTTIVLTGVFTVISVFVLTQKNLNHLLTRWGQSVELAVFLNDNVNSTDLSRIESMMKSAGVFKEIKFVSKDEAAQKFQAQMGRYLPNLAQDPELSRPLPASIEGRLSTNMIGSNNYGKMVDLAKEMTNQSGVLDVSYGQGWVENYAVVVNVVTSFFRGLVVVLLLGALLIIGNVIRSTIFQRRDEIEVLELVGATRAMVRLPFIMEGAWLGGIASLFSVVVVYFLFLWQQSRVTTQLAFWSSLAELNFLNFAEIFLLVGLGMIFGSLGAYLCLRQISTGWAVTEGK